MDAIKLDPEVLEKLWNGDLYIAENCHLKDEEYRELTRELGEIHAQLLEMLPENNRVCKLFERYKQQASSIAEREHLEAFKMGVTLGLSMVAEAFGLSAGCSF